jgi:predicted metal-binding membrane protein
VTTQAQHHLPEGTGLAPAFAAARARLGLVALLLVLAGLGWWWTVERMRGMDAGPWTGLGTIGWFLGVWVVMMAAMMFPSVAPTVALYSRMTSERSALSPLLFAAGYLLTWAGAGVLAFAIALSERRIAGDVLAWDRAGRWVAGGTLVVAAVYELTPLKDVCLGKCRSPLGSLLGSWHGGRGGAVRMGTKNGVWCVGCCWALMASLFALIAAEKTLPWRRFAMYGTAGILIGLGAFLLIAPEAIPALTIPSPVPQMMQMGS